jgi:non-specific serine/threonine protein kinase
MLANEIGDRSRVAFALAALGGVAAFQGEPTRALRLGAAATSIREAIGESFSAAWRARFDRWLDTAHRALSEAASAAAWAEGRALSLAQAIEYAVRPAAVIEPADAAGVAPDPAAQLFPLSPREREVAMLVARGMTNRQIATELVITEDTAANHVRHIRARLGFSSRVQIAVWMIERGAPGCSPT